MMTYRDVLIITLISLAFGVLLVLSETILWPLLRWPFVFPDGFYNGVGCGIGLMFVASVTLIQQRDAKKANA